MSESPKNKLCSADDPSGAINNFEEANKKALSFIENITMDADEVQKKVLEEILSRNAEVEYLRKHGLNGHTDPETFKRLIPVITYDDISPYVHRIANGDTSPILCSSPISELFTSSGTSGGKRKLMPGTVEDIERRNDFVNLIIPIMSQFVPGLDKGKGMRFMFIKAEAKTPGGLVAHPALTSYYKRLFSAQKPFDLCTSPKETVLCLDTNQSMYSQLLCGLCQNMKVIRIGASFASGLVRAIKFLENHWEFLCHDIRSGTLNPDIITDLSVREAVSTKVLSKPNKDLADFIECECRKGSWQGIVTRLWPNTKYVESIITGAMAQYIPTLDYYCNGLPKVSTTYASSESYFGINLNPFCEPGEISYTILPNMAYFEFLPMNQRVRGNKGDFQDEIGNISTPVVLEEEEPIDLIDVKLGEEYEVVVTTYAGLYRYRVGDILRVTGFKNKAPQFKFICRKDVILSIDFDKTTEVELQNAVKKASDHLLAYDAILLDYTSYANISSIPGHYVLFWEIRYNGSTEVPASILEDCCLIIEESLNSVYRQGRVSYKSIGPLEIKVVKNGTFDKLVDYALNNGASLSQYKTPRCVKHAPIIELLNSRVVSSYFSPRCPKWVPGHKQWYGINCS